MLIVIDNNFIPRLTLYNNLSNLLNSKGIIIIIQDNSTKKEVITLKNKISLFKNGNKKKDSLEHADYCGVYSSPYMDYAPA